MSSWISMPKNEMGKKCENCGTNYFLIGTRDSENSVSVFKGFTAICPVCGWLLEPNKPQSLREHGEEKLPEEKGDGR
jgi:hypothetical protein